MEKLKHKVYIISKKIGDHFGFDLPYFIENGFWVILAQVVNVVASLAMSIVFARHLSKETFGEYQLVLSFLGIFAILSYSGLNTSIMRSVAKGFDYSYVKAVNYSFKKSLLAIPVFLVLSAWYYYQSKYELSFILIAAGLFFSFIYAHNKWAAYKKGKADFENVAKQQILQNVSLNISLIASAVLFPESLFVIMGAYLIINAGFHTFWHFKTKHTITNKKNDDDCIPYGKYMTKMSLFSVIISYFDKIVIGFIDIEMLAVYAIALKLFNVVKQMIKSFYSISSPKFAKKNIKIGNDKIFLLLFIGSVATIILYLISKPVIIYFYTDSYSEVSDIFRKLIFVLPLVFINPLFTNKISAQKKKKKIAYVKIISPVVSLILSISVFIIFENIEFFILTKVYVYNIVNFIILTPWFLKNNN